MKKIMLVFVTASLLLALCGGGAQPAATEAPASKKPIEITFTMWGAPEELAV